MGSQCLAGCDIWGVERGNKQIKRFISVLWQSVSLGCNEPLSARAQSSLSDASNPIRTEGQTLIMYWCDVVESCTTMNGSPLWGHPTVSCCHLGANESRGGLTHYLLSGGGGVRKYTVQVGTGSEWCDHSVVTALTGCSCVSLTDIRVQTSDCWQLIGSDVRLFLHLNCEHGAASPPEQDIIPL